MNVSIWIYGWMDEYIYIYIYISNDGYIKLSLFIIEVYIIIQTSYFNKILYFLYYIYSRLNVIYIYTYITKHN